MPRRQAPRLVVTAGPRDYVATVQRDILIQVRGVESKTQLASGATASVQIEPAQTPDWPGQLFFYFDIDGEDDAEISMFTDPATVEAIAELFSRAVDAARERGLLPSARRPSKRGVLS